MNKYGKLFFLFLLFLQINPALSSSHRKIQYTVEIFNMCKPRITKLTIHYDGEALFPDGGNRDLSYYSSRIYGMPMVIPDEARVAWRDSEGTQYEEKVPLRSLISFWNYFGRTFRINFNFCKDELHVVFGKKKAPFEYDLKEIWNNQNDKESLTDKVA